MQPTLFLCTSHGLGGLELNLVKLARWMGQSGRQVQFVAGLGEPQAAVAREQGLPVTEVTRRTRYMDLRAARAVVAAARDAGAEHLVVSTTPDIDLAVWARVLCGNRLKVTYLQQMPLARKRDPIHTWKYRNLHAWVAPLPYLADMTRERTHMPHARIHIVPLCIELARFTDNPMTREQARAALELPEDGLWFGVIGRMDPQKGMHTAVEAFAQVAATVPEARLLLLGEPTRGEGEAYADLVAAMIHDSPCADRIFRRPFRSDVETAHRALDVFLMASKAEPFGMVTVEALASGCAVIGTRSGGTPDLLGHGDCGVLVAPEDPRALCDAILRRAQDGGLRRKLAQAGPAAASRYAHTVQVEGVGRILDA